MQAAATELCQLIAPAWTPFLSMASA